MTGPVVGVVVESSNAERGAAKSGTVLFSRLERERERGRESAPAGCPGSDLRATDSLKI